MEKYFLGLDIGTDSCGFAVTDEKYNIIKKHGKKLWGVRLFDSAETAAVRRGQRTNRRRLQRRGLKLLWLRELFLDEIEKLDKTFFSRMKYSNLWQDDKEKMDSGIKSKFSLFDCQINGEKYTDREFYKDYPTIYHLRNTLLNEPAKDARFLYLAIHNIIKRRGHFLTEADMDGNGSICQIATQLAENFNQCQDDYLNTVSLNFDREKEKELVKALRETKGKRDLKIKVKQLFDAAQNKQWGKLIESLIDGKFRLSDLFEGSEDKTDYFFDSENYETEVLGELEQKLGDEQLNLLEQIKSLYSILQLRKILGENEYISTSMVCQYEKHRTQLEEFKSFIKKYFPSKKHEVFRQNAGSGEKANYSIYIKQTKYNGKKQILSDKVKEKDYVAFTKYVKSIISQLPEVENIDNEQFEQEKNKFLTLIENDDFLPRLRSKANAVFPNKLYEKELKKILEINSEKFQFLGIKDESGLTVSEKILKILTFRVPYFVGPIGRSENAENNFTWAERDKTKDYKPWTLAEIVDFDKAEDKFIERMTNKCIYLKDEDVLPKNSILYSKFKVLNELNNLKINGNPISVELKQKIYNEMFLKFKKVSKNKLVDFLVSENLITADDKKENNYSITGIDKDFANNLAPYIAFSNILGESFVHENISIVETIIKYITIISDKTRLEKRLRKEFSGVLDDRQITQIKGLNFSSWGALSAKFLSGLEVIDFETGEKTNIINLLWDTNLNLQEIMSKYKINQALEELKAEEKIDLSYDLVQESYCSPSVKRATWQALKIVREVIEIMGDKPERVFVEVTRHDEEKGEAGRKDSRKESLQKLYGSKEFQKYVEETNINLQELMRELDQKDNLELRSEKLYLYFLQMGKCAYTGKKIDIFDLSNDNLYDIDHIIPQSIKKDDSISNKVLVQKIENLRKTDQYPLDSSIINRMDKRYWQPWKCLGLMTEGKYSKLIRRTELTEDEKGAFIARQLVETNQSAKAVLDILKEYLESPKKVVYSKAKFVSMFRNKYNIIKCREVNDLHHAKDAYLNIVVGNIIFNRYTDDPRRFYIKEDKNKGVTRRVSGIFDKEIKSFSSEEIVWHGREDIERVQKICGYNDCLVTRMSFCNLNGQFYDETVYRKTSGKNGKTDLISLKSDTNPMSNTERYGGYKSAKTAYFMVFESDGKNGVRKKTIETLPTMIYRKYKDSENPQKEYENYIIEANDLKNAKVLLPRLNIQSTLKIGKGTYILAGKTGNQYVLHNFNQYYADKKTNDYFAHISKYFDMKRKNMTTRLEEKDGVVVLSEARKKGNTEIVLTRAENESAYDQIISQLKKNIYDDTVLSSVVRNDMINNREKFLVLSVLEQVELLNEVMKAVKTGAQTADLKLIGETSGKGKLLIGKDITDKDISLIIPSVTGIKNKIIKL